MNELQAHRTHLVMAAHLNELFSQLCITLNEYLKDRRTFSVVRHFVNDCNMNSIYSRELEAGSNESHQNA